ncbi:MAG: UDP-N-acetylmuramate dehydrogenase [Burkholderiales bacterium]|nr:UDP-N-acetylmuramate dehydrogenase [Burkholderiales bacterium]
MNALRAADLVGLRGELRENEPMGRYCTWRAGGSADRLYVPADLEDLAEFLARVPTEEPLLFVGLGSNLLVREGGWRGTVVLMHAAKKSPKLADGRIYAEAGVASPKVARFAAMNDLAGAEFLAGIPGTVGGALAMNAGCYGGETWQIVEEAQTIDRHGRLRWRHKSEFETGYRHCRLKSGGRLGLDHWFAAALFRLAPGERDASREAMRNLLERRLRSQPLSLPNAGSVFRNPPGQHAAKLIEACGLKGLARGGARVSEMHANFIVNPKGAARAADIEWLIREVQRVVREKQGVELVPEVQLVGEPA